MKSGHELSPFFDLKSDGRASSNGDGRGEVEVAAVELVADELADRVTGAVKVVRDSDSSAEAEVCLRSDDVVLSSSSLVEEVLFSLSSLDDSSSCLRLNSFSTSGTAAANRPLGMAIRVSRLRGIRGTSREAGAVICGGSAVGEAETVDAREARITTAEKTSRLRVVTRVGVRHSRRDAVEEHGCDIVEAGTRAT